MTAFYWWLALVAGFLCVLVWIAGCDRRHDDGMDKTHIGVNKVLKGK